MDLLKFQTRSSSDILRGWDFESGWTAEDGVVIDDAVSFTDSSGSGLGIYLTTGVLTVGSRFKLILLGSTDSSGISIRVSFDDSGSHIIATDFGVIDFEVGSGSDGKLYIKADDDGTITVTQLQLVRIR